MKFRINSDPWLEKILKRKCYNLELDKKNGKNFLSFPKGFITCKLDSNCFEESFFFSQKNLYLLTTNLHLVGNFKNQR